MIKYRASKLAGKIEKIEILKETDSSVFTEKRREKKETEYHIYKDTFEEAKQALINYREREIEKLKGYINYHEEVLEKIKLLEEN